MSERDKNRAFLAWLGVMVIGLAGVFSGLAVAVVQQFRGAYDHSPLFCIVFGFFLFTFSMGRAK